MTVHTLLSFFGTLVLRLSVVLLRVLAFIADLVKTMLAMMAPTK